MNKIDVIRFGLAGGLVSALIIFVLTLIASASGYGLEALNVWKSLFIGYDISAFGSLIGAIYGFMVGFLEFFLIAFVYNLLGTPKE